MCIDCNALQCNLSKTRTRAAYRTDWKALGFLNDVVFTEKYGARASAPKVLVILTDGQDATPQLVIEEARKLHQKDVIVFAIGVGAQGSLNMDLLSKVATEPVVEHIKSAATVEGTLAEMTIEPLAGLTVRGFLYSRSISFSW